MKKNILFIIPWIPYPMKSGGHQAIYNGIVAVKNDFNIYLTYEAWEGEEYRNAEQGFLQKIPQAHLLPLVYETKKEETSFKTRVIGKIKKIIRLLLNLPYQQQMIQDEHKIGFMIFHPIHLNSMSTFTTYATKISLILFKWKCPK